MTSGFKSFGSDQRGAVMIWLSVSMIALIGLATLAIDMSYLYVTQTRLQGAADAAALAAASELPDEAAARTVAIDYAVKNMPVAEFGNVLAPADVEVGSWDAAARAFSAGANPINAVRVSTRRAHENGNAANLFFANVLGVAQANVSTSAIAGPGLAPLCILALDPSASGALSLDSNASIAADTCRVHVNSTSLSALSTNSTASITAQDICVTGDYSQGGSSTLTPTPMVSCAALDDPLAGLAPPAVGACDHTNAVYDDDDGDTLDPGVYCGGLRILDEGEVTLNPGTYIVSDAPLFVDSSASLSGSGVTFYLTDGATLSFNSNSRIDLTGATSGPLAGLVFFQDRNDTGTNTLDSNNIARLEGTLYFPNGVLESNSNSTIGGSSAYTLLIARRFRFDSNAGVVLNTDFASSSVPVPAGLGATATALYK